jgi:hypothetical protein
VGGFHVCIESITDPNPFTDDESETVDKLIYALVDELTKRALPGADDTPPRF